MIFFLFLIFSCLSNFHASLDLNFFLNLNLKIPHGLIAAFKSTLEEINYTDILLHVVDISHPDFEDHIASVNQILQDIKSADKPTIMVFNKIDAFLKGLLHLFVI